MENKDTRTDYQELVSVGDQKRDMVEITIGITFLFEIHIHYFSYIQGIFMSHLKKITPTQSANSHPKLQFNLNPYYINFLKNCSTQGDANYETPLDISM